MQGVELFEKELEKEITRLTNTLSKAKSLLLDQSVVDYFTEDRIWDVRPREFHSVSNRLTGENALKKDEYMFIETIISLPDNLKRVKKKIGTSKEQKELLDAVRRKVQNMVNEYNDDEIKKLEETIKKYKVLLNKVSNDDTELIDEFEIVKAIIGKMNVSLDEKFNIYSSINEKNNRVIDKYNEKNNTSDTEQDLDDEGVEVVLEETNISEDVLLDLARKYDIKWLLDNDLDTEDNIKYAIQYWKERLLKFGNIDKFDKILSLLRDYRLESVFDKTEIISKILLYSTADLIKFTIQEAIDNEIDYKDFFETFSVGLFPPVKENKAIIRRKGPRNKSNEEVNEKKVQTSGKNHNFHKNLAFLKEMGIRPKDVYKDVPCFFIKSNKAVRRVFGQLAKYGIHFVNPDGSLKKGFSILDSSGVLDKLDVALECGCFPYVEDNLSTLHLPDFNPYKIKYAKSLGKEDKDIYRLYKNKGLKRCLPKAFKENSEYGITPEETKKLYGSSEYMSPKKEEYDEILENNTNDNINNIENDMYIDYLDSEFKDSDERLYNFDGVIISRFKVLRLYHTLVADPNINPDEDLLMYVITKDTMLTAEEIEKIKNLVVTNGKRRELS